MKRIAIDIDGTVADYIAGAIPKMKELFDLAPLPGQEPQTVEELDTLFGLNAERPDLLSRFYSKEQEDPIKVMKKRLYDEGRLFRDLPLLEPDIAKMTWDLKDAGYLVYIITARWGTPETVEDTMFWLNKNVFYYTDVFFTKQKAHLCQLMRINVLMEDKATQIMSALENGMDVIIRDQTWNRGIEHLNARRIKSWKEVLPTLQELKP